jgi:hypothetical protein
MRLSPKSDPLTFLIFFSVLLAACSGTKQTSGSGGGTTGPFTIGGAVSGLSGTGLVLQDTGGDNLTVSASGQRRRQPDAPMPTLGARDILAPGGPMLSETSGSSAEKVGN